MPLVVQRASIKSFVDDTNISQVIQKPEGTMHLQIEFDTIYKWTEKNGK